MKVPPELDAITKKVLTYNPDAPKGPLKVIAGAPDSPLVIGDIEIPCYVLEDETRVLSQRGFLGAIGRSERQPSRISTGADKLPVFLSSAALKPFISKDLAASTNPIEFQPPDGGRSAYGFRATLLPEVCVVYLKARDAGVLRASQLHIAERADLLIRGLATVGIIALVDEATGYQRIREKRALATILERFIAKELQPWTKTFPLEFYTEICRLKGWPSVNAIRRPSVIGKYTNDIVYARVAPGVLDELRRFNPSLPGGGRKWRHHQWFTPDPGYIKLNQHLAAVIALMNAANNWEQFQRFLKRAFPKLRDQLDFDFGDGQ